ncbi:hypothetical protein BN946_scf184759.g4 [Trametes cinnabarina]|uniref:Non-canonical E2 ubiquitin-conjugating enzyme C-terminal domain-containing protein n=1 Tax=Pycnoporus cinnabarinus TaxID=5643 RepID=A0A060SBA2_PYCCI|nr:hypothetical protein BN946_scf184759.g4 [Trametes cinnabarina]
MSSDDASTSDQAKSPEDPSAVAFSLENILSGDHENIEHPTAPKEALTSAGGWEEEAAHEDVAQGFCVECEVCFAAQHRKGTRKRHATRPLAGPHGKKIKRETQEVAPPTNEDASNGDAMHVDGAPAKDSDEELERAVDEASSSKIDVVLSAQPTPGSAVGEWFVERSKYIPLRLTLEERKYLRLLEAALNVSEYTDKIDTIGFGLSKAKRIVHQIRELCAILSGLVLSADYKHGQALFQDRDFKSNEKFYQDIFELGRRHKIMNPDKMRSTYGKLIYILQDSQTPEVKDLLGFTCVKPIKTVHTVLEEHDALDLLRDDLVSVATKEIYSEGRTRRDVQRDIKAKERAIETLASKYARRGSLSEEQVRQCLYSIGDNHAFLRTNRDPCERMIAYLKQYFHPTHPGDSKSSLAIKNGKGGARLTHDHSKQYAYVLQSLTLWREILHDMFHLWTLAEQDLLNENVPYRLRDTGQGLNRVQAAPKTSRMMHAILNRAQRSIGSWVGSSVIHMGDHNVPNALMFIDKYSQVYRILLPICNTLAQIPRLAAENAALRSYIDNEWGSPDGCVREILADFFRHGFDGSGAGNYFDAGSCIDGRLTSAWNWCSTLEKKRFFPVFLLTGFIGFDGEW